MELKKVVFILVFVFLGVLSVYILIDDSDRATICLNRGCFSVEIVQTPETRIQGLSFRESLGGDEGMLFVFEESGNYSFWMKDMKFPLDIIWINENFEVVYIEQGVPVCEGFCEIYSSPYDSKYVLEVQSGIVKKKNIFIGDLLVFS